MYNIFIEQKRFLIRLLILVIHNGKLVKPRLEKSRLMD